MIKVGIGQDSHRFGEVGKKLVLGGVIFEDEIGLMANSDGDVVLHAITNAISGITCVNIIGKISDEMCEDGIIDSAEYLREALKYFEGKIVHISIAIECLRPKITPMIGKMRENIAKILDVREEDVGITATSGEGLTDFGKGLGISCFACVTAEV